MHTVLFYTQHDNEAPVLVPIEVVSRDADGEGYLTLAEPLEMQGRTLQRVPAQRCYEYDPYLAHAVQAYAAQVSTLVRVSQSVIEGLAVPVGTPGVVVSADARVH